MKTLILSLFLSSFVANFAGAADIQEAHKALQELNKFNAEIGQHMTELDRAHKEAAEIKRVPDKYSAESVQAQKSRFDSIVQEIENTRARKAEVFGPNADGLAADFRKSLESGSGKAEAAEKFLKTVKAPFVAKFKGGKAKYGIAAAAVTVGAAVLSNSSGASAAEFKAPEAQQNNSEKRSDVEIGTLDAN